MFLGFRWRGPSKKKKKKLTQRLERLVPSITGIGLRFDHKVDGTGDFTLCMTYYANFMGNFSINTALKKKVVYCSVNNTSVSNSML